MSNLKDEETYLAFDLLLLFGSPLGEKLVGIGASRDVGEELCSHIVLSREHPRSTLYVRS